MNYLGELNRLCRLVGFNFDLLAAQALHETANFTSPIWRTRLNPVGLGVTDGGDDGIAFASGTDAARAHVVHMCCYVFDRLVHPWITRADVPGAGTFDLREYRNLDPRMERVWNQPWAGTVRTLSDLTGRWASDPKYAAKIAAKANALLDAAQKGAPMATPTIYSLATDYARFGLTQAEASRILDNRFTNRVQGAVQGRIEYLVYHIQDGTTVSSLDWWANGPGVQASSNYMVQRDGSILIVIPEQHGPWTNGDDMYPTPAGQPLVDLPGNSNIWSVTIEAEGTPADPPTNYPRQMDALEWLTRDIVARNPALTPASRRIQHADVNRIGKPNCAGVYYPVIKARTADIGSKPAKPEPSPIWWEPGDQWGPQKRAHDGALAWAFLGEVTAKRNVPIRKDAHANAPVVHRLKAGDRVQIVGTHKAANKTVWAFIEYAPGKVGRSLLSAFEPYRWPTV